MRALIAAIAVGLVQPALAQDEHQHHHHAAPAAEGSRESSGTSWQPQAAPHQGIHATYGEWETMTHGFANLVYDRQGGPRGGTKTFSSSMLMVMGERQVEGGSVGLRAMVSLDPLMGKRGYPLLLQTGETANGQPLIDRQHPHDLFMELSGRYTRNLSEGRSAYLYAGLPGEPALGPPAFMHRFSGEDNPEAPISHHWLDSTHISWGVLTAGYVAGSWKVEGSLFNGREPDERRYDIELKRLDSVSARLSWNPTANWSLQASAGKLRSPEAAHVGEDIARTTASVIYHASSAGMDWQSTLAWGRNRPSAGAATDTWLLESAIRMHGAHTFFARGERSRKNELFAAPPLDDVVFNVAKVSAGYVYDLPSEGRFRVGLGGLLSRYLLPQSLERFYGEPTSFMLFARVRIR